MAFIIVGGREVKDKNKWKLLRYGNTVYKEMRCKHCEGSGIFQKMVGSLESIHEEALQRNQVYDRGRNVYKYKAKRMSKVSIERAIRWDKAIFLKSIGHTFREMGKLMGVSPGRARDIFITGKKRRPYTYKFCNPLKNEETGR